MSNRESWLQASAAGRELLLPTRELLEVISAPALQPMPARPRGIGGVVLHQGEFLPVLAWEDLPGCPRSLAPPVALAVLRQRLGLPLQALGKSLELAPEAWRQGPAEDPWALWTRGITTVEGRALPGLDLDCLIALLRQFPAGR